MAAVIWVHRGSVAEVAPRMLLPKMDSQRAPTFACFTVTRDRPRPAVDDIRPVQGGSLDWAGFQERQSAA